MGVLLLFVGCVSVEKHPNAYMLSPRVEKIIENLPDKKWRIEAFNMSLGHMQTVDSAAFTSSCLSELHKYLLAQPALASYYQNQKAGINTINLGIWLGITYKKQIVNTKLVRSYECSLIVAVKGGGQDYEELLVNTSFLISRPFEQKESVLEIEKGVINDALLTASDIIGSMFNQV